MSKNSEKGNLENILDATRKIYTNGGDIIVSSAVGFFKGYNFGSGEPNNLGVNIAHYALPFVNGYIREGYKFRKDTKYLEKEKPRIDDARDLFALPFFYLALSNEYDKHRPSAFQEGVKRGVLTAICSWVAFGAGYAFAKMK